jgi:ketosteroid isomerase-like protein
MSPFLAAQVDMNAGGSQVGPRYSWASASFSDGQMTSQVLATHASGDLAYTVELERWDARLASTGATVTLELRVTHVYRREEGVLEVDPLPWGSSEAESDHRRTRGGVA